MQLAGWQCGVNDLFVVQLFQLIGGGREKRMEPKMKGMADRMK